MVNPAWELPFLKDENLDPELKKILLQKLLDERAQKVLLSTTQADKQEAADLERKKFWHNTPLVVALVGTITIFANGLVAFLQSQQAASNSIAIKELES